MATLDPISTRVFAFLLRVPRIVSPRLSRSPRIVPILSAILPVLHALRKANIHVVALHNHMMGEQPAFYFTHFWGKGPVQDLAKGLSSALEAQKEARSKGH